MNRQISKVSYFLVLSILLLLFSKASSSSSSPIIAPTSRYINVQILTFQASDFASKSFDYTHNFLQAKVDTKYQVGLSIAKLQYKNLQIDTMVIDYSLKTRSKSLSSVKITINAYYKNTIGILSIYLLILQREFSNCSFSQLFWSVFQILSPNVQFSKEWDINIPTGSTIYTSFLGLTILSYNFDYGFQVKSLATNTQKLKITLKSIGPTKLQVYNVFLSIFCFDNSLLASGSPAANIYYGTFSDTTGSNANLKAVDSQLITRSFNTIIGLSAFRFTNQKFMYSCNVKPSEYLQAESQGAWTKLFFQYMVFQFQDCPQATPYLVTSANVCYDTCPARYIQNIQRLQCTACPYDCYECNSNGQCTSCSIADFREMNSSKRCVPIQGYYESNVTKASPCMTNCQKCLNISYCEKCIKDLMFKDLECRENCTVKTEKTGIKYVYIQKVCFSCKSVSLYSNGTAFNTSTCNCNETFIFNSTTKTCVCPQENSVVIEGKCFPCGNILQYSNRTVFNESTCNCNDTFIFNSTAKTCDCPLPNSVVIGGKCFPCANISLYSNRTAFNTSTCNCNETFIFNSTTKTCVCPQENSVVIEGKCFPCGNILQYSNRTVFNESTCNCNDTFIFNSTAKTCDCPLPNSVVIGGKCFPCANISLYSNRTAFNTSTCNCNETFIFNSTTKTCVCPQENSVVIEGKCFPCGNILQYSNRTVFNESTCNCNDTFIFNSTAKTCDCPLPNSVVIGGKCFPCANISLYSNRTAFNTSTCNCNETFIFNSTTKTCVCPQENSVVIEGKCFPCGNILQYSNRTVFNESTCNCNDTFIFNSTAKTCDCPLPNSVVIGGKCFPCANISLYSNRTAFNTSTCNCNETFIFNSTTKTCVCPQENSVVIEGKCFPCGNILQYSNRTVFNESTCNCNDTFIFNSTAKTCDCPLPNSVVIGGKCFPCANISLYSNRTAFNTSTCNCNETFIFNSTTKTCVCPQENSVVIEGKCFPCGNILQYSNRTVFNESTCNCNDTFIFNSTAKTCDCPLPNSVVIGGKCFPCANISLYSNRTAFNTSTCNCNETFIFNSTTKTCVCPQENSVVIEGKCFPCGNILQYSNRTVFNESTCNCNDTFIFNSTAKTCDCPLPNSVVIGGKCFPCANISLYSNRTAFNTSTCNCNETFIFNSTTKTCVCPQENSVIIQGKCFSCFQLIDFFSSGLINSSQPDSCECNSTFAFNKTAKACQCPFNSVILDGKCFLCTDLKDKNSSGLINLTSDSPACQCFPTFVFNTTSKSCECPDSNSYISLDGRCVSCSGVGPVDQANRTCICAPNYIYNRTTNKCFCLVSKLLSLNACFSCSSIRYRNSTGLVDSKDGSLCECYRSFVFNTQTNVCQCPDPLSYVSVSLVCVSCRDIGNNTNEVNGTACACSQSYVYNANLNKCLCPLASIIINNLCFSCYTLAGKNCSGLVSPTNLKQCQCTVTFTFNAETKQCSCPNDVNYFVSNQNKCVSCLNIENGNGEALASSKVCQCNETYIYSAFQNKCICPAGSIVLQNGQCFSCQTLKGENSSGLVNTVTKDTCECFTTFVFNSASKSCECPQGQFVSKRGKCFSCAGAEGTGEFNQTSKECACNETYIYSSFLNKCICPPTSVVINSQCFVCSTLKGKNGTGEISKTSSSACECLQSFVFTEEKTCECPNAANSFVSKSGLCVSCIGIVNGVNDQADLTSKSCLCKESFVYHQGTNQCRCPLSSVIIDSLCFQCSTLKNKNSTGAVSNTDPSSCSCLTSFVFDPVSKTCLCPNDANSFVSSAGKCVSCIGIQNGQNDLANITAKTCVCKKSLVYVESVNKCECPQSSIIINGECFSCSTLTNKNSTGGINVTTGNTCRCLRSYVFNPNTKACECPDEANSYISPTKQCVSCIGVQNGTGTATKNGCECKDSTFVFYSSSRKCLCPPKYSLIGDSCTLTAQSQVAKEVVCPRNLQWDIFLQKCICRVRYVLKGNECIECKSIANAIGDASDKLSCICEEGFTWDSAEYSCK